MEVQFYWRRGGKVTSLLKYYPLNFFAFPPFHLIGDKMKKRGKGAVIHILFFR
jgi:hypothetical protein